MKTPESGLWRDAMQTEMDHHASNGAWTYGKAPEGVTVLPSMWVLDIKRTETGVVERYKGRIVAKGFAQRPGFDFNETFAPTIRQSTLRVLCAMAAQDDLHMRSVDITAAFTNGDLDETIYMQQPEGFHVGDPNTVCVLGKAIYGLKQASRQWNLKLHDALSSMGYSRLKCDHSLYLYVKGTVQIQETAPPPILTIRPPVDLPDSRSPPWSPSVYVRKGSPSSTFPL